MELEISELWWRRRWMLAAAVADWSQACCLVRRRQTDGCWLRRLALLLLVGDLENKGEA